MNHRLEADKFPDTESPEERPDEEDLEEKEGLEN